LDFLSKLEFRKIDKGKMTFGDRDYMHLSLIMRREGLKAEDMEKMYSSLKIGELIKFQ
jgi:hypothetical protein